MTQFKFLTSWYQVPLKDCIEGIKPYLFDYANKELFIYSAVNKTSYSIVTIGFYKEDKEFSNPIIKNAEGEWKCIKVISKDHSIVYFNYT